MPTPSSWTVTASWPTVSRYGCSATITTLRTSPRKRSSPHGSSYPRFKANSRFTTWLYQIVTRKTLNRITRTRATQSLDLLGDIPATGDEPAQQTERDLTVDAVTAAVAALPPPQRIAIVLRHFEGLSNAEIARITTSTIPAVRSHLFRGRRTLSQTLEQWR